MPEVDGHIRPKPTKAAKRSIQSFAERAATTLKFGTGDPIEPLVIRLGGKVEYCAPSKDEPNRLPESIVVRSVKDFTIFIPTMTSAERDRFTIAHELGHLFLHYPMVTQGQKDVIMAATRWVDEADPIQQRAEWEANWFAAAFLMPAEVFRDALCKWGDNIEMVAIMFGVSKKAAEVRRKTL